MDIRRSFTAWDCKAVMQAFYSYSAWKVLTMYMLSDFFKVNIYFCLSIPEPEEFYVRKNINFLIKSCPSNQRSSNLWVFKSLFKN